jgi:hypothetical protein
MTILKNKNCVYRDKNGIRLCFIKSEFNYNLFVRVKDGHRLYYKSDVDFMTENQWQNHIKSNPQIG